jgi:MFS family permease
MNEKDQETIVPNGNFPTDVTSPIPKIEVNIHLFILEIAWWGITVGFLVNFLSIYIVHLRASSLLVGALTYGPMLVATFGQLPAARLLRRHGHRRKWMINSIFATRIIYLFIAFIPLVISTRLAEVSVLLIILQAIPGSFAGISVLSILADAVPINRMAEVLVNIHT